MAFSTKFKCGQKVREVSTGFEGIITGLIDQAYSVPRLIIQPPVDKEGKIPTTHEFDETTVDLLEGGITERVCEPGTPLFTLLQRVRCPRTGQEGIISANILAMNGCILVGFKPDGVDADGWPMAQRCMAQQELQPLPGEQTEAPMARTGAPSRSGGWQRE